MSRNRILNFDVYRNSILPIRIQMAAGEEFNLDISFFDSVSGIPKVINDPNFGSLSLRLYPLNLTPDFLAASGIDQIQIPSSQITLRTIPSALNRLQLIIPKAVVDDVFKPNIMYTGSLRRETTDSVDPFQERYAELVFVKKDIVTNPVRSLSIFTSIGDTSFIQTSALAA